MIVFGLIASIASMLLAIGMLTTLVPLHAAGVGFDPQAIGWIAGFYYAGFLVAPWIAPALAARLSVRGAFAGAALLALASVALLPFMPYTAAWGPLRLLAGIGFGMLYILVEAGLNAEATNHNRGRLLSTYLVASKAALIGGQFLVGLLGVEGWLPFAAAAACVALATILHLTFPSRTGGVAATTLRPVRIFRSAPVAVIGCFVFGLTEATFFALGALFGRAHGLQIAQVSTFMSAFLLGGALAQWPLGLLSDRIDRRHSVLLGAIGTVFAGFLLGLVREPSPAVLAVLGFVFGAMLLPLYGLCVALANDVAAPAERVELSSGLMFAYASGAVIGPPLAAALMEAQVGAMPIFCAGLYAAFTIALLASLRRSPPAGPGNGIAAPAHVPDLGPEPPGAR